MSFSGQSNPPWQRNNLNNVLQGQIVGGSPSVTQLPNAGLSFHQGATAPMFLQQPQQNMTFGHGSIPPTSIGTSAMFQQGSGASVSYPQTRSGLNPVAFQNSPTNSQPTSQNRSQQQYNSIGTITKMNGDCGLVNDEILFYRNVCKGPIPKLGERVIFEASYNPNGQFKWNASRIQLMPQPRLNSSQPPPLLTGNSGANNSKVSGSGYNAVPPPNDYQRSQQQRRASPRRSSPGRDRHARNEKDRRDRDRNVRSRDRDDDDHDRKRRREDRDRSKDRIRSSNALVSRSDRDRDRDRDRDEIKRESDPNIDRRDRERDRERTRERERDRDKERERSPVQRMGQKTRRTRTIRRYMVQIPKSILTFKSADIQELRQRYSTLYIPSDFFHAEIKWSDSFTHANPFSLRRPCQFHIMHKIVEPLKDQTSEVVEPEDANYLYSAKVMLMACPPIAEIYQKCFEDDDNENEQHTVHPSRLISFLVGTRGRNEPMAIGGPWSPSLDGENPDKDPSVLIRTAIRTCKTLTGIDLSNCTQWYRFVELYYHRTDHKNKDKDVPPRIETVVIYLPDVHSCIPTISEWENLTQSYKVAVENVVSRKTTNQKTSSGSDATGSATLANDFNPDNATVPDTSANVETTEEQSRTDNWENTSFNPDQSMDNKEVMDVSADGDDNENEKDVVIGPTHYSKLDLKTMKLQDIRNELDARNLPSKGARNLLMARLAKAINVEKADGESNPCDEPNDSINAGEAERSTECDISVEKNIETKTNKTEENDENEDWADVDMNDIVILDEYDSSKNPDDSNKELDEKEKMQLIRRYTLPSSPHIIVHPSKSAKGGKFDCSVMSLSVLLDYRPEDTKERFFEVSLFAELFNEMLMRDFGFNIYKELYLQKEASPVEQESSNDSTNIKKDDIKPNEDDEQVKDNIDSIDVSTEKRERRISKHSVDMDPDDDNHSINSSADRKRKANSNASDKKMVVVKPQLLLSFVYFDTTHCGYIFEKDLEDLFSILGLNLSRGQIRKVLGKSASRHAFYYRKLTEKEESFDAPPTIEESDEISNEELTKLALGNKFYYPIFKSEGDKTAQFSNDTKVTDDNEGLINYRGAVVHVGKLMEQIKRTEINYSDLEKLYNDLSKQYAELQKEHTKSSAKIKDLQNEVKSLNRKLSDTDQDLYSINRKYKDQQSTLSYIYNRVSPYFNRDKEHKSESSRDKDEKGEKNKEKENDKLKESKDKDKVQKKEDEKDKRGMEKETKIEDIKEGLENENSVNEENKTEDVKNE